MNNDAKALRVELAHMRGRLISNEILQDRIAELEKENASLKEAKKKLERQLKELTNGTENS